VILRSISRVEFEVPVDHAATRSTGTSCLVMLIASLALAHLASAQETPIEIPNASFEARADFDPFSEGTDKYNLWAEEGWQHFEISHNGGPLRIWNPGTPGVDETEQGALDVGFGGDAPDGDYVIVVRSRQNDSTNSPDDPQIRDFEAAAQILDATFDPTRTYTLSAEVGRLAGSINYEPDWFGYAIQLVVGGENRDGARFAVQVGGGTVLALEVDVGDVPEDDWVVASVTYTPDPAHADLAGLPLQIRLCALEDPDDHSLTGWVAFDDVQLTTAGANEEGVRFRRGDVNADGNVNLSDAVSILNYLFTGGEVPTCLKTSDTNDNGGALPDLTDAVYLLNFLFAGGPGIPPPFDECGADPTPEGDELTCESYEPCP